MKITNKFNLPEPIYRAVSEVYPPKKDRLSVTDLINPPLIKHLKIKHWDELEEDASALLWPLLGKAMDNILTSYAPSTWIKQLKLEYAMDGFVIVGRLDYLVVAIATTLGDWKATSVWSYLLGGKIEWEKQLNCYDWLTNVVLGIRADHLEVQRLLRDWQQNKARREKDYPQIPFVSLKVRQWSVEEQENYIAQRIAAYKALPVECTPEEKWEKPTTYAVMKKGRKSALRVLDRKDRAEDWCWKNDLYDHTSGCAVQAAAVADEFAAMGCTCKKGLNKSISIVERSGECTRCLSYCPVRKVCKFNKDMK